MAQSKSKAIIIVPHKPPVCPICGKELRSVHEDVLELYDFDEATGTYKEVRGAGVLAITCPNCETDLSDIFPEGACNYNG